MAGFRFFQLDVFTDTPLAGNPLAVFPDARGLNGPTMQRIAREMNLSETTFVTPSDRATRKVRFFTPTAEIPLAGHPTIGTWWLLAERGELDLAESGTTRITQDTPAGILPVDIGTAGGAPAGVTMTQTGPEFLVEVTEPAELAREIGADPRHLTDDVPQVVSTAVPQLMVRLDSREALRQLPVGGTGAGLAAYLDTLGTQCVMCCVLEGEEAHCRMFAPGYGVPEDPATGSASGALGAYLVQRGLLRARGGTAELTVHQGIEIGRPSRIQVSVDADDNGIHAVRVGGTAVTVIDGALTI